MSSQHVEGEIRLWRDKYVTRIEREMYLAFPSLEKTLLELVQNNLKMLFLGRTEKFRSTIVQPAVREWYETVVRPILDDANQELQHVIDKYGIPEIDAVGMPSTRDVVIPVVTSTVGFVVLFGSVFLGIGSRSVLWVFTIPVLNKVLLIIGTLLGAILLALGVGQVVFMKERVAKRFSKSVIPRLREALLGSGFDEKGVRHESVRRQHQLLIEETAEKLIDEVAGNRNHENDTL